jgi:hypothetical protein
VIKPDGRPLPRITTGGDAASAVSGDVCLVALTDWILGIMGSYASRGRPWGPGDLTGGPVDEILARVRATVPGLTVERLQVTHSGDDDNVYFLGDEHDVDCVQIDTGADGRPPFLIEAGERFETSDVAEAASVVSSWLGSGNVGACDDPADAP